MRLLEMSRTKIMHHDTRGLLAEHPTIYSQFEDMARKLQKQEYNPKDMMSIWLQIGKCASSGCSFLQIFTRIIHIYNLECSKIIWLNVFCFFEIDVTEDKG